MPVLAASLAQEIPGRAELIVLPGCVLLVLHGAATLRLKGEAGRAGGG